MKKKILLAGGTGFLGSHLAHFFHENDYDLTVISRKGSNLWRIQDISRLNCINIEETSLHEIFNTIKPNVVVNTVCNYGRKNDSLVDIINANLVFGIQMLEQSIKHNVSNYLNIDTLLPKNTNNYSLSKRHMTEWLQRCSYKINVINMRVEHMYGHKDDENKFIEWLITRMLSEDSIDLTDGLQKRDFIYVTDVVNACKLALERLGSGIGWNSFDIGTGVFVSIKEFVLKLAEYVEIKYNIKVKNRLNFGAIAKRANEQLEPILNNEPIMRLGWVPQINIDEGIKRVVDYRYSLKTGN